MMTKLFNIQTKKLFVNANVFHSYARNYTTNFNMLHMQNCFYDNLISNVKITEDLFINTDIIKDKQLESPVIAECRNKRTTIALRKRAKRKYGKKISLRYR